ncbi:hypothetical protein SESBI_28468 [Sesbania bispinosa]|nr:hypothetical protein SESBI_28468 [Sesbania bispinosa]
MVEKPNVVLEFQGGGAKEGLSLEEEDNLARSTKKAKVNEEDEGSQAEAVGMETIPSPSIEKVDETQEVAETPLPGKAPGSKEVQMHDVVPPKLNNTKNASYKDVILGVNGVTSEESSDEEDDSSSPDSEGETDHSDYEEQDNKGVSVDQLKRACKPWQNSVIVKLLGKKVGLKFLQLRLLKLWNTLGDMEIIDLEYDYFLVRFSNPNDYEIVFQSGPWMITGHYLVVQKWQPNFYPLEDELIRVVVWVRIPGLPMECYDRDILWSIGNSLGKTIKVDSNILKPRDGYWGQTMAERGKFARMCIEVDLRKTLVSNFRLNGRRFQVEYEVKDNNGGGDVPMAEEDVARKDEGTTAVVQENQVQGRGDFGPWMLVQKQNRKRPIAPKKLQHQMQQAQTWRPQSWGRSVGPGSLHYKKCKRKRIIRMRLCLWWNPLGKEVEVFNHRPPDVGPSHLIASLKEPVKGQTDLQNQGVGDTQIPKYPEGVIIALECHRNS